VRLACECPYEEVELVLDGFELDAQLAAAVPDQIGAQGREPPDPPRD
jgi:hypothetical protein